MRLVTFGHVGDGNLHYNLSKPVGADDDAFLARGARRSTRIDLRRGRGCGGSISAEHGIGRAQARRDGARTSRPVELDLMRAVKRALDPRGLMNPGKVLP